MHSTKHYLLALIAACLCAALVGCAATPSEPPRTIDEWMALEQVHP